MSFDTSGRVLALPGAAHHAPAYCWDDISPFAQGYVEALMASGAATWNWHGTHGFDAIAPEAMDLILKDCAKVRPFYYDGISWGSVALGVDRAAGRDFWRHRSAGKSTFPPLTVTLGDDGKVYLRPAA